MKLNKRGISLVEVLISSLIFLVLSGVVVMAYISSQRSFTTGVALMDVNNDARLCIDSLEKDIRWSNMLLPSHTFGATTYTTGDDELVLSIPSITSSGDIIDGSFDFVAYHLNSSDPTLLERTIEPTGGARTAHTHVVSRNVDTLNFSANGVGLSSVSPVAAVESVTVSITTSKTILGGRDLQETLMSTFMLRNN